MGIYIVGANKGRSWLPKRSVIQNTVISTRWFGKTHFTDSPFYSGQQLNLYTFNCTMIKPLYELLLFPARTAEKGNAPKYITLATMVSMVLICAFSFQYIYPRILDELPLLGTIRQATTLMNNAVIFNLPMFLRGLAMAISIFAVGFLVHLLSGRLLRAGNKQGWSTSQTLSSSTGSVVPLIYTSILGTFLVDIHYSMGFLPLLGLMAGCCIHYGIQVNQQKIWRNLAIYLAPTVLGGQIYVIILFLP